MIGMTRNHRWKNLYFSGTKRLSEWYKSLIYGKTFRPKKATSENVAFLK